MRLTLNKSYGKEICLAIIEIAKQNGYSVGPQAESLINNDNFSTYPHLRFDSEDTFKIVLTRDKGTDSLESLLEAVSKKESVTVKLNNDYHAVVKKDTITVGCQTFPITIVEELQKALDTLS